MDPNTPLQPYQPPATNGAYPPVQPMQPGYALPQTPMMPAGAYPPMPTSMPTSYPPLPPNGPQGGLPSGPIAQQSPMPPAGVGLPPENAPQNIRQELIDKLRSANNVLVTVSNNPSVDQLSAAIGLTLILNKLDKHATAVYSGATPSTIEFLQPGKTLEKNTDSLRDFIIALDKAKADKLRYKVEDKFVKIFITPYHTSLSQEDLEFSQGDFNVDVVVAIGVHRREELDEAITAHGRILHDAVTASVNNKQMSDLGTLNWFQPDASSLCEMLVGIIEPIQGDKVLLDEQIATAFLTGVVAETERFSNEKTTPHTMNIAATLMKAGANQQLVSSKLNVPEAPHKDSGAQKPEGSTAEGSVAVPAPSKDGSLEIDHTKVAAPAPQAKTLEEMDKANKEQGDEGEDSDLAKIHIDDEGKLVSAQAKQASAPLAEQPASGASSNMILQPPTLGGSLSSTTSGAQPASDVTATESSPTSTDPGLNPHNRVLQPLTEEEKSKGQTLDQIERSVDSPHVNPDQQSAADAARQAVASASNVAPAGALEPVAALNAQPIDLQSGGSPAPTDIPAPVPTAVPEATEAEPLTNEEVFPTQLIGPDKGLPPDPTAGASDPTAPPPVPPPMMPTV